MIKIDKPDDPPDILKTKGKRKRRSHCISYSHNKEEYDRGDKKFPFDSDIYGHKTVKEALKLAQRGKCCFCEAKIEHIAHGDVEHFRPKAGYKQNENDDLARPGYYWLAYEWDNLFFCCQLCNQRHKKNLFPLANPDRRARSHKDDVTDEHPLLIDPSLEDPDEYISFRMDMPFAIDGNLKGTRTIEILGLDRVELCEDRLDLYKRLKFLHDIVSLDLPFDIKRNAQKQLADAVKKSAEYASMARAAIAAGFRE